MSLNLVKVVTAAVLAVVLVVAMLVDADTSEWAVPVLGLLVGYVIGNAQVTENAPIVKRPPS